MIRFLLVLLVLCVPWPASRAEAGPEVPQAALQYLPILVRVQQELMPDFPYPEFFAGQVEQETCISLKHSKCWNPKAELKTDREYGFGLGQITITKDFNNFEAIKKLDSRLKAWEWRDRYNGEYQIIGLIAYDNHIYVSVAKMADSDLDAAAFMFCAYNGGLGGLIKDRNICSSTPGCDRTKWFGHVAKQSFRAKKPAKGYGKSFFEINREYVHNIMNVRGPRYREVMNGKD